MDTEQDVDMMSIEDDFEMPQRTRRTTSKKHWITPRLCSALDKAKVKRMRLKN